MIFRSARARRRNWPSRKSDVANASVGAICSRRIGFTRKAIAPIEYVDLMRPWVKLITLYHQRRGKYRGAVSLESLRDR